MDIEKILLNANINKVLTVEVESDLILVIELLKKQNNNELIEGKIINFALRKLFSELGLIDGEITQENLMFNRNHIRVYINKNIIKDVKSHVIADELYEHYYGWCIQNKFIPLTKQFFYREIVGIGAIKRRNAKGYKFNGITLIK